MSGNGPARGNTFAPGRRPAGQVEICLSTADRWFIPKRPMSSDGSSAQGSATQRIHP